jgi:hypothetical protein
VLAKRTPGEACPPHLLWFSHMEGAMGECAVAKALGLYWQAGVNEFQLPDVGRFQVRTTSNNSLGLRLKPKDRDNDFYISVSGSMPRYRLRGFILGAKGKRSKWWGNPDPNRPSCYWVPVSELHPMSELR